MHYFNNSSQKDLQELKNKINKLSLEIERLQKLVRKR